MMIGNFICLISRLKTIVHVQTKGNRSSLSSFSLTKSSFCFLCSLSTSKKESPLQKEERLLALCKRGSTINDFKQIHGRIVKTGFHRSLFLIGKIILFCAVCSHGEMGYAESVFNEVENPDGFIWNTMIRGLGKAGQFPKAFELYRKMQAKGEVADNFTFSFLLKACVQLEFFMLGKQMHCNAMKYGLETHKFVRNTLIYMYGMSKDVGTARKLFDEMPFADIVNWNVLIDCHVYCGEYKEALDLFLRMCNCGIEPDEVTLVVTISACAALGALDFGRWIHSCIRDTNFGDTPSVGNSLIDMYAKSGALDEARETFSSMKSKSIVSWNSMIHGLACHGYGKEALALFSDLLGKNLVKPDDVTFLGVLTACSHAGMVDEGKRYFHFMTNDCHIQPNIKHYGCMVDILGRTGLVEEAYQLAESMPIQHNAIVWRSLLSACQNHGCVELGEKVRKLLLKLELDHSGDYVLLSKLYAVQGQWNNMTRERRSMRENRVHKPEPGTSVVAIVSSHEGSN